MYSKLQTLLATLSALSMASSALAQIQIPTNLVVRAPFTSGGGNLRGEYWKRPVYSVPLDGSTSPTNRIDNLINGFGPPTATFKATKLVYTGNDLTHVTNWLDTDAKSFVGQTNNLDDGVFRFTGFINITNPGTVSLGTASDDGSRITIGGINIINNDGSHGDQTADTNIVFAAAGVYPIEVTYFNGDWTSDGTGDKLNHSGNPDPSVHGGANFHLRVGGADVASTNGASMFYSDAGSIVVPATLSAGAPVATGGGTLSGEYWKRPTYSIATDGTTNPTNRIDVQLGRFGSPDGTFTASQFTFLGNDLTGITNWLGKDAKSFVGVTNNLDDGAFRFKGFVSVANAGTTLKLGTASDDGSRITIGGIDIINNDGSHGDQTADTNVFFGAAGLYPIEVTYFNGDWTSDGTGDKLNHSGNPDPSVHGGANFHLRVNGADATNQTAAIFHASGPAIVVPGKLAAAPPYANPPASTNGGRSLYGEYWRRPTYSIATDGVSNPNNRIDVQLGRFGAPDGTFQAKNLVYTGNDLTWVKTWLGSDSKSFAGEPDNLDDGAFRFTGFLNVPVPGTVKLGTASDDGSRITIGGIDIINNDGSHGDQTADTNVVFAAAGLYPIEITYFNGDWTSDGTGDKLNHSGNPDPSVHGGANFHLRVSGADVNVTNAIMFSTPVVPPLDPRLLSFEFDEGKGTNTTETINRLVGTLGIGLPIDPGNVPEVVTDTPSGAANDHAISLNAGSANSQAALLVNDTYGNSSPGKLLAFATNAAFTIETWIKIAPDDTRMYEGLAAYGKSYKMGLLNQQLQFTLYGVVDINSGIFPTKGEWHHVAAAWTPGTGVEFFLDGVSVTNMPETRVPKAYQNNILTIGSENVGAANLANCFQGCIDRFRIHAAALTAADLDSVATTPKAPLASSVVAYAFDEAGWPFPNGAGLPLRAAVPNPTPKWTTNTPSSIAGDSALSFQPGTQVIVPDTNQIVQLDPANPSFTMQAWVNFAGNPATRQVFYYNNGPGGALSFSVYTNRTIYVTTLGVKDQFSNAQIPDDGKWHHIAVVHENKKELRFYVDGALADTQPYTGSVNFTRTNQVFYLGSEPTFGLQYTGMLDRLKINRGMLTADQLDYPAISKEPSLSIEWNQTGVVITFEGTLESTDDIASGNWQTVTGSSPLTVTPAGARFYRAKR